MYASSTSSFFTVGDRKLKTQHSSISKERKNWLDLTISKRHRYFFINNVFDLKFSLIKRNTNTNLHTDEIPKIQSGVHGYGNHHL